LQFIRYSLSSRHMNINFQKRIILSASSILFFLSACVDKTSQNLNSDGAKPSALQVSPTEAATPKPPPDPPNPFKNENFPKPSCGDTLPSNDTEYPVSFFPVFVEYSEANLSSIQQKYCRDAFQNYRKEKQKDSIQVASFNGRERATFFRELLSSEYQGAEVGSPTVIAARPNSSPTPAPTRSPRSANRSNPSRVGNFDRFETRCSQLPERYQDVELKYCHSLYPKAFLKNYSSNWYEVKFSDGFRLIAPSEEELFFFTNNSRERQISLVIRRIQGKPTRRVQLSCDDPPMKIWRLEITPTCNSSGTYVDIKSGFMYSGDPKAPIQLRLDSGETLMFGAGHSSRGWLTSTSRNMSFTLSIR